VAVRSDEVVVVGVAEGGETGTVEGVVAVRGGGEAVGSRWGLLGREPRGARWEMGGGRRAARRRRALGGGRSGIVRCAAAELPGRGAPTAANRGAAPLRGGRGKQTVVVGAVVAVLLVGCASAPPTSREVVSSPTSEAERFEGERLASLRNLGKALYENPATQYDAVEVLREAWELSGEARDRVNYGLGLMRAGQEEAGLAELAAAQEEAPEIPHTWWNLGLAAEKAGRYEEAQRQLAGLLERVPGEPAAHYHLGILAKLTGDVPAALDHFERSAAADPYFAAPRFQLAASYRQAGRAEEAERANAAFRELKRLQADDAVPEDPDWSFYSELFDPLAATAAAAAPAAEPVFAVQEIAALGPLGSAGGGVAALEADGVAGTAEIVAWTASRVAVFAGDGTLLADSAAAGETGRAAGGAAAAADGARDTLAGAGAAPAGARRAALAGEAAARGGADEASAGDRTAARDAEGARAGDAEGGSAAPAAEATARPAPLPAAAGIAYVAAGDFDDDGRADLALATATGARLWRNREDGWSEVALPESLAGRAFVHALWLDFDHDYDLDLLLLGDRPALVRNLGGGDFEEATERFPFVPGRATAAAVLDLVADTPALDVAVAYADRPGVLYRDLLGGRYEARDLPALPAGAGRLAAVDFDNDGWTDLAAATADGVLLLGNDRREGLALQAQRDGGAASAAAADSSPGPDGGGEPSDAAAGDVAAGGGAGSGTAPAAVTAAAAPTLPYALADLEGRGILDLVTPAGVVRNLGFRRFTETPRPLAALAALAGAPPADTAPVDTAPVGPAPTDTASAGTAPSDTAAPAALVAADLDGDGLPELVALAADGRLLRLDNRTETANRRLHVALEGVKNLKLAPGAEVEVKAGTSYQKRLYHGVPLVFGLGPHAAAEVVRITWPNGLIQNETELAAGPLHEIREAQRLSGSCPMVFTWNGREFEFVTDVLGVAPLGAAAGDGVYFDVDHDESIQIAAEQLVPRDGRYHVRLTEELREVGYLDRIELVAVDHPAEVAIYTSEKFVGPPYGPLRLYGVRQPIRPRAARDHRGADVTDRVLARDRSYPDGFRRDFSGLAELHWLELDFGPAPANAAAAPDGEAILVLHGWVDWADGSTFMATAQGGSGPAVVMPYLQVEDEDGEWVTVIDNMGLPAGKPKTIVVDLSGKWLSAARKVRIVTSLCVYWDEVFLATETGEPEARLTRLSPAAADLRFRGFSGLVQHPERKQPEWFVYAERRFTSMWNPTPGLYTRFGDVRELLAEVDDRFVVFGSGDEVALEFDATALPPLPVGWRRDFLLAVDGWAKDGDANTAHSQTVGPLPFRGMSGYPYGAEEGYPESEEHRRYVEEWLTRPALELTRPLRPEGARAAARAGEAARGAEAAEEAENGTRGER
jgi:tetratricopeptide (TPR) repeat protein